MDRFLAEVAHDLRQPLSVIEACTGMLLKLALPPNARKLIEQIQVATARIGHLGEELLLGAGELTRQAFDLAELVPPLCKNLQLIHPGRTIELDTHAAKGRWDWRRVTRIVQNLLDNAVRHGDAGGSVMLSCGATSGQAWLVVENRCREIAPAELEELFQPFRHRGARGHTGLGLHIARELARAHGGELSASWRSGWIRFELVLPTGIGAGGFSTPRRHLRSALDRELQIAAGDRQFRARGQDISLGGVAFVGEVELKESDAIEVAVRSECASYSVRGTVRHVRRQESGVIVGVEFAGNLSPAEVDLLKQRPS